MHYHNGLLSIIIISNIKFASNSYSEKLILNKFRKVDHMKWKMEADIDEKGGATISTSYVVHRPIVFLGMGQELDDIKEFDKLPWNAAYFVRFIQDFVGIPVKYISTGPKREDLIILN